jgi:hypothetical protein
MRQRWKSCVRRIVIQIAELNPFFQILDGSGVIEEQLSTFIENDSMPPLSIPRTQAISTLQLSDWRAQLLQDPGQLDTSEKIRRFERDFTYMTPWDKLKACFTFNSSKADILKAVAQCYIASTPEGRQHLTRENRLREAMDSSRYLLGELTAAARAQMLATPVLSGSGQIVLKLPVECDGGMISEIRLPLTADCFGQGQGSIAKEEALDLLNARNSDENSLLRQLASPMNGECSMDLAETKCMEALVCKATDNGKSKTITRREWNKIVERVHSAYGRAGIQEKAEAVYERMGMKGEMPGIDEHDEALLVQNAELCSYLGSNREAAKIYKDLKMPIHEANAHQKAGDSKKAAEIYGREGLTRKAADASKMAQFRVSDQPTHT